MAADKRTTDKLQNWVDMNPHELTNLTSSIASSDELIDDLLELNESIEEIILSPVEAEHRAYIETLRASYGAKRTESVVHSPEPVPTGTDIDVAEGYGICFGDTYGITTLDDWTINHYVASGAYYSSGASGGCTPDASDIPAYILTEITDWEEMDTGAASGTIDWRLIHWSSRWSAAYWHLQMPMGFRGTYGVLDRIDKFTTGKTIQERNYDKYENIKDLYNIYLGNGGSWTSTTILSGSDYGAAVGSADGLPVHNNLRGIDGDGTYHLTEIQHDDLTDGGDCSSHTHEGLGAGQGSGSEWGSVNVLNGTNTVSITFTDTKASSGYSITGNLSNTVEQPSIYPHIISSKSVSGFSVTFAGNMDGSEYYYLWSAVETVDTGITNITNGLNTVIVSFSGPRTNSTYIINYSIRNDTDVTPSIFPSILTTKSVNGFAITMSGNADSSNYYLEWSIGS